MDVTLALVQALLVVVLFWLPGGAALAAFGVRGLRLASLAPAVTVAVLSAGAVLAGALDVRWSLGPALAVTLVAVGAAAGARRVGARLRTGGDSSVPVPAPVPGSPTGGPATVGTPPSTGTPTPEAPTPGARPARHTLVLTLGVTASVVIQLLPFLGAVLARDIVPNVTDPQFHLNALQHVRTEGTATPEALARLVDPTGGVGAYPSGWHAVAGLAPVLLDPSSLLAAASYVPLVLALTLGLVALARSVRPGAGARSGTLTALVAATGVTLPLGIVIQPGLIPNGLALALVPAALAFVIERLRAPQAHGALRSLAVLATVGAGIAMCHPNALAALVLLASPWVLTAGVRWWRSAGVRGRVVVALAVVTVAGATVAALASSSTVALVGTSGVQAHEGLGEAVTGLALGRVGESLTYAIIPTAFALLGAVSRLRRRGERLPVVSWALAIALMLAAATSVEVLAPLTGLFYGESRRLAGVVGLWTVVLASEAIQRVSTALVARVRVPDRVGMVGAAGLVCGFLVAFPVYATYSTHTLMWLSLSTQRLVLPAPQGTFVPYFTPGELALAHRLGDELPPGSRVLGSSFSGVSHLYGLEGIDVVPFYGLTLPDDLVYAADRFEDLGTDPAVCAGLEAHGVTHVYSDAYLMRGTTWPEWQTPFQSLPESGLRVTDQGGTVTVYEVTGCG